MQLVCDYFKGQPVLVAPFFAIFYGGYFGSFSKMKFLLLRSENPVQLFVINNFNEYIQLFVFLFQLSL